MFFSTDIASTFRSLLRRRLSTLTMVVTLALGLGLTTALFSVLYTVVLRPFPFPAPDELVLIEGTNPELGIESSRLSMGDFYDLREHATRFEEIAAMGNASLVMTSEGEPEEIPTAAVSANFFRLLGVQPMIGRDLLAEEETPGLDQVVISSHRLWQRRFGGDPRVVGKELTLSGYRYVIVGVLPKEFELFGRDIDFWSPMSLDTEKLVRKRRGMTVFGRLQTGQTLEEGQQEIDRLMSQLQQAHPDTNRGWQARLSPLHERIVGKARPILSTLLGATVLVLLLAWSNVANLLATRAVERRQELAVRRALGASNSSLLRLFLLEASILGLFGGAFALLLAHWSLTALRHLSPTLPRLEAVKLDPPTVLFATIVALMGSLLIGAITALQALRRRDPTALREAIQKMSGGRKQLRLGTGLVVTQTAIALILAIGSGLLIQSFARLSAVELGFRTERLLVLNLYLPFSKYTDGDARGEFFSQLLPRLRIVPGVESVASSSSVPLNRPARPADRAFTIEGRVDGTAVGERRADIRLVSPDYFQTLGIPLLAGRDFSTADQRGAPPVAILSQSLARRFWPGENPLGQRLKMAYQEPESFEIIGLVGDVRDSHDREPKSMIYLSSTQYPSFFASIVVRTATEPLEVLPALKARVWSLDPEQALTVNTMESNIETSLGDRRLPLLLLTLFAALALLLTALGIYGLIAVWVGRRTTEIGIRMSFGARPRDILRLVLTRSLMLVGLGIAGGGIGAFLAVRLLRSWLYEISPTDQPTFAIAALVVFAVALLASWLPTRRAIAIDPARAIRHE